MRLIVEGMLEGRGERVRLRGDVKGGGGGQEVVRVQVCQHQ